MYLMVESGIRGGISTITKRYGKANNGYMKNYNPKEKSVYLPYFDANNQHGWAMSQPLPVGGFAWMTAEEMQQWENHSCILEVDPEYPEELHNLHNEYPLAPERLRINGVDKLIPNLNARKSMSSTTET